MDQRTAIIIVFVVVIVMIIMALSLSQQGKTCSGSRSAAGQRKISGPKMRPSSKSPTLGAAEAPMAHTEADRLRSPLYPMRQILDQLTLIEGHCADRRARCYECLAKHMMTIEAWADFGCSLAGGNTDDYSKIAQSISDKLTEVRQVGMVKSRMGDWAKSLYNKIRAAYPDLDKDYNQLDTYEIQEVEVPLLALRLPHFNLRQICKLMIFCEGLTAHPKLRCLECLRYFMAQAAALAAEGSEMSPSLRPEYERVRDSLNEKLAELLESGIGEETSQWFRTERKRLNEAYPELHEQGLYENYDKPAYLAKCGKTCK